ncbi:MAG TPA: bacillithiol biosynthesis cysteine-adding enzyme BshC [Terriglobales bacterium]|nr:bacillithiol biosynthesis cysteine-adding enzyme BshC [Terriglobales bacterium]
MKAQCLPFRQIPHASQLFTDFLSWVPPVRQFFPRPPNFSHWLKDETGRLRYDSAIRAQVSSVLEAQNKNWGASSKALDNMARLRAGATAVVTGQQVGLFGGPLFSIFKALSAIKLAEQATAAGVDAVPVFWLATLDHDLAEINNISIPGPGGALHNLATPTQSVPDAPVGSVSFGPEIDSVVEAASGLLGESEIVGWLHESYRTGENFGSAFARFFTRLFTEWGVVLLDASDPTLTRIAAPIYRAAIERAAELDDALLARGKELESAGYHQQVRVTPSSTLLFVLRDGARTVVHRRPNGSSEPDFLVGNEKISQAKMLDEISSSAEHFSPNVLLRPVVQDYLLPTLAYTGGSAEVAYFAQAAVVYQTLSGRATPVVPRFSATLVEPKQQALLERYRISLPDLFHGSDALRETLAARTLPQELQSAFEQADDVMKNSLAKIQDCLAHLDKTLVDAAINAGSKIHHQLDQLRSRAARAELRQTEVLARHADLLSNMLYPNKALQEREIAGLYFVARHGLGLLRDLYDAIHTDCLDHQIVSL